MAQVSAANVNRDGTGDLVTVFTAGANGSRVESVQVKAIGATTPGMVRLFVCDETAARLLTEIPVTQNAVSGSVASFEDGRQLELVIPSGFKLKASTHNAEAFNVLAFGGNF
jgi:hypothetical protein